MCSNRFKKGQRVLGGFGEYIAVRASQIYPIPDSMSFREAAFAEPVACCIRSLKKVGLTLAEDVLIVGAGPMGIMHQQAALCMGARVFVSDPDTERLALTEKLGAYRTIDPTREDPGEVLRSETDGRGADVCVITSPAASALKNGFEAVGKVGRLNIYTSYSEKLPFPMDANTLHRNEVLVTGSEGRTEQDFLQAVRLVGFGKIDVSPLISETVGLNDIEKGLAAAMSPKTYRVLLEHEL
jgi:L-iditol 2-dehydrogenase